MVEVLSHGLGLERVRGQVEAPPQTQIAVTLALSLSLWRSLRRLSRCPTHRCCCRTVSEISLPRQYSRPDRLEGCGGQQPLYVCVLYFWTAGRVTRCTEHVHLRQGMEDRPQRRSEIDLVGDKQTATSCVAMSDFLRSPSFFKQLRPRPQHSISCLQPRILQREIGRQREE